MKQTNTALSLIVLGVVLMATSCSVTHGDDSSNTLFSIEKITEEAFQRALKNYELYNLYPADSIVENDIVKRIRDDAQNRIEQSDSIIWVNDVQSEDDLRKYYPTLNLYGFVYYDLSDNRYIWWYDANTGDYLGNGGQTPIIMSVSGRYVSQTLYDCDWILNLHFYKHSGNYIIEEESYYNKLYCGEIISYSDALDYDFPRYMFWGESDALYIKTSTNDTQEDIYLKVML